MKAVISANALTRTFGNNTAVNALSLQVYRGEVFGLLGHNGAGKTTTVRLLNGVLSISSGTATVLGMDPSTDGALLRRQTGVLTETPSMDERLTAFQNLSIFAALYDVPASDIESRVYELLNEFDLVEVSHQKVGAFSKGMKQRLAIARTLIHHPELIFLDEPTAGLDPVATRQLHSLIARLSKIENRTVVLCTHNLNEAQQLCDRAAILEHGRVLAMDAVASLLAQFRPSTDVDIEVSETATETARVLAATSHDVEILSNVLTVKDVQRDAIPTLLARLISNDIDVFSVKPAEHSLESVYFALHHQQEGTE